MNVNPTLIGPFFHYGCILLSFPSPPHPAFFFLQMNDMDSYAYIWLL